MRYDYQHLDWRELANRLAMEGKLDELFRELMLAVNGDVEEAFNQLDELDEKLRRQFGVDRDEFERRLRENRLIEGEPGERRMTAKGERLLRSSCLESVFGKLRAGGGRGDHLVPRSGSRGEPNGLQRPWQPGDESQDIAYRESLLGSYRRGEGLAEEDLVVHERDRQVSAATVMLIDVSHSMTLYGEDRITPAKRVAMAFAELQRRKYPRDSLDILLFGDDVREVPIAELPYISNGPFHTNTCEALRRAGEILVKRHQPNKRVVMITDGKPTALFTGKKDRQGRRELVVNSSYGLDPEIVTATLNQAARYPRQGIELTVFMVAEDPYLQQFVGRLVEVSKGQAFHASLADLGAQVMRRIYGRD